MITRQSHTTIFVLNQDEALTFYRDILGFEVRTDMTVEDGFRWLTVGPKTQPDLQLILVEPKEGPMFDAEKAEQVRSLISQGTFGIGVFDTEDCQATYEDLRSKGVEFIAPPMERFYGIEALAKDNSGNWFSLTQQKG